MNIRKRFFYIQISTNRPHCSGRFITVFQHSPVAIVDKAFLSYRLADQLQYAYTNVSPASAVYVGQSIQALVQWLKVESNGCSLQLERTPTQTK